MMHERRTNRWRKGHIKVGTPPKNINTRSKTGNNKSISMVNHLTGLQMTLFAENWKVFSTVKFCTSNNWSY